MTDIALTPEEIERLTGGLSQARRQLTELHSRGFWRARLIRGHVILERAHYEAVCAGALPPNERSGDTRSRPQLQAIK